ncbi:hypothetical protein P7C70_g286, partial [Phenoliferia sp. Uapishka_3]
MRGSMPLNHIDSSHQVEEDSENHYEETPPGSPGHSSATLPTRDVEKGGAVPGIETANKLGGAASRSKTLPAEERAWKDDIVLWDSRDDPHNPKVCPKRYSPSRYIAEY